jgi:RNA polymerase sigma-70 factor, ECF subfamily
MELIITNENILLEQLKNKEEKAFVHVVNSYNKKLINISYKLINDIEISKEIVQDVFFDFFKLVDNFNGKSKIFTYLYRITINKSIDRLRKIILSKKIKIEKINPDINLENIETKIIVNEALIKLDDNLKIPLLQVEYEQLKYEEVAEILDIPINTVKMRIFYARKKLLKIFDKMGYKL